MTYFVCSPGFEECLRFIRRTSIEQTFHGLFIPFLSFYQSYQVQFFAQDVNGSITAGLFRAAHASSKEDFLQKKRRSIIFLKGQYSYAQHKIVGLLRFSVMFVFPCMVDIVCVYRLNVQTYVCILLLEVELLCNISNRRDSVSSTLPNTEKRVKKRRAGGVFLMKFEVFSCVWIADEIIIIIIMKHCIECLIYLLNRNKN